MDPKQLTIEQVQEILLKEKYVCDRSLATVVYLSLYNSEIIDSRPLVGLKNLSRLYLGGNHIVDVDPLAASAHFSMRLVHPHDLHPARRVRYWKYPAPSGE